MPFALSATLRVPCRSLSGSPWPLLSRTVRPGWHRRNAGYPLHIVNDMTWLPSDGACNGAAERRCARRPMAVIVLVDQFRLAVSTAIVAVWLLTGCRGCAPAGMAHGCAALHLAAGAAQECGPGPGANPTADPFFHAYQGNSCRWQQPPAALRAALEAARI